MAGLADSMPVILARQGRHFDAKVAPELASSGYCPTKKRYDYGVKIHLIGDRRPGTLPAPRKLGVQILHDDISLSNRFTARLTVA